MTPSEIESANFSRSTSTQKATTCSLTHYTVHGIFQLAWDEENSFYRRLELKASPPINTPTQQALHWFGWSSSCKNSSQYISLLAQHITWSSHMVTMRLSNHFSVVWPVGMRSRIVFQNCQWRRLKKTRIPVQWITQSAANVSDLGRRNFSAGRWQPQSLANREGYVSENNRGLED